MELDININALVQLKTDEFIETANYASLRQSCLDSTKSPITEVIKQQLDGALIREKEKSKTALTTRACSNQLQQDIQETQQDDQERHRDELTDNTLNLELAEITPQITHYNLEIIRVNSLITRIQHDLDRVNQKNYMLTHQHAHVHAKRFKSSQTKFRCNTSKPCSNPRA